MYPENQSFLKKTKPNASYLSHINIFALINASR